MQIIKLNDQIVEKDEMIGNLHDQLNEQAQKLDSYGVRIAKAMAVEQQHSGLLARAEQAEQQLQS